LSEVILVVRILSLVSGKIWWSWLASFWYKTSAW